MRSILLLVCFGLVATGAFAVEDPDPARFQGDFDEFAKLDKKYPAKPGGVLFLGSSTIRLWDLQQWFPELKARNRGFGGSHISDSVKMYDKVLKPFQPGTVVFYAGDNDIAAEKTPEQVSEDFSELLAKIRADFPECKVIYLSIKPSAKRWALWDEMQDANARIKATLDKDAHGLFVDMSDLMLGPDGKPIPHLLASDGLHLNVNGYEVWSKRVAEVLNTKVGERKAEHQAEKKAK